ncbi:hypothetical protein BaRGS_00017493, partial [Batillaria attramentaria]
TPDGANASFSVKGDNASGEVVDRRGFSLVWATPCHVERDDSSRLGVYMTVELDPSIADYSQAC